MSNNFVAAKMQFMFTLSLTSKHAHAFYRQSLIYSAEQPPEVWRG
jgi:hypothetical protein